MVQILQRARPLDQQNLEQAVVQTGQLAEYRAEAAH